MILGNIDYGLNDRWLIGSKNSEVNDRLATASLILRSQAQCGTSYTINFLQDFNMIFQFFAGARHLGFEDVQAVVDLISDAVQISGLLIDTVLYDSFCSDLCNLLCYLVPLCHPFVPSCTGIKRIQAYPILRSNEASSLAPRNSRSMTFQSTANALPISRAYTTSYIRSTNL